MKKLFKLCFAFAFVASVSAQPADDPAAEIPSFQVADGYEINLFASEREGVVKPIQLRFDPAGRLWVIGSTVYPQIEPGEVPNDKVVVLEDTNGDGRADTSRVFADGLMIPTGLELGDGGVYIGQTTTLLHLRDTDGDGKADARRVLLRGFGTGDSHQTINSFTWGPGGELMMCQGLHALSRVETPWGIERLHSAGVWRLRPRTLRLDPFLNEEMGPQNPFGIAFDRWGGVIMLGGNGQGIYYMTPGMIRAPKHRTLQSIWNTGRKFGGPDFVENSHFPPEAQGQLITGNYLNNSVYRFKVTEEGSGYKVIDLPPLITTTNKSFRIVDARFGPDGALYLCDWWNPVIGHYQASFRHPDRDKSRGRIWRVTAKGRPLVPRKNLEAAPLPEVLEELKSPESWNRQMAKRALADRPAAEVVPALKRWAAALDPSAANYEHHLFEAAGALESHGAHDTNLLARLISAQDQRARAYAARVLGHLNADIPAAPQMLERLATDAHPRVRLEAVVASSYFTDPRAIAIALRVLDLPMDYFLEYALAQTVHTLKPHWLEAFQSGGLQFNNRSHLEHLLRTDASPDTLRLVRERFAKPDLEPGLRLSFARIMAEVGTAEDAARLVSGEGFRSPEAHAEALRFLRENYPIRKIRPTGLTDAALLKLVDGRSAQLSAVALRLAGAYGLRSLNERAAELALASSASEEVRLAAAEALGQFKSEEALARVVAASANASLTVAALDALASVDLNHAARLAAAELSRSAEATDGIMRAFLRLRGGPAALLAAFDQVRPLAAAAKRALETMAATGKRDPQLASFLESASGSARKMSELTAQEVAALAAEVKASGNAARGREIYARAELGCVACHAIGGDGGTIGPDLVSLGTAQDVPFIIGAILEPNKEVKEGFVSTSIITKDDEEFQGYVIRETAGEIALRVPPNQQERRIPRAQVKSKQPHGSLMPAGLCDTLSREEFRDLVRFLSQLGTQPQP